MKVLITTDWYKPVVNGVVTSVLNLKAELEKQGHEVRVLTLSPDGKQRYQDDTYYLKSFNVKIYPQAKATYSFINKYLPKILEWKPDIIHSQCEMVSFYFAKYIANTLNIPIVHTYHTIYEDYTHYVFGGKVPGGAYLKKTMISGLNLIIKSTDYIITPTDKARNLLISYGIKKPIVTVPTGITLDKYRVKITQEHKKELLEAQGITSDKTVVVTVGRLAKEKNVDELLHHMKAFSDIRKDVVLLVVGGGPYESELHKLAEQLELGDSVVFTGMVPPEQVHEYFQLGRVFLCASQSEAQGLTYVEALASGLPLLCKYDPCLDGVLIDGNNGFFFEDYAGFAEHLNDILIDENLRRSLHLNAYISSERFSTETFGKTVAQVYETAIETFDGHTALFPGRIMPQRMNPAKLIPKIRKRRKRLVRRILKR